MIRLPPPLAVSMWEHWVEFKGGESSPSWGPSELCRSRTGVLQGGTQPADKGWATGVFGRCWLLFTLKLPQSSFTGILRKRQAGRAPLNSPPQEREDYLNGSGGDECRVNVKWGDGSGRKRRRFHMHDSAPFHHFPIFILLIHVCC